jgi:hypothetical protein
MLPNQYVTTHFNKHTLTLFFHSQLNTVRQYVPLASFVVALGEPALDALRNYVKANPGSAIHAFKALQALIDWKFMKPVLLVMAQPRPKPSDLAQAISKASYNMWLNWHLCHPDLGDEVHPLRSMFICHISQCTMYHPILRNSW